MTLSHPVPNAPSLEVRPLRWDLSDRRTVAIWLGLALWLMIVRRADAFLNPQFWAEDFIFLISAEKFGYATLWEPQAGYLHMLPRLIALLAVPADPAWQPRLFVGASVLTMLAVMASALSSRLSLPGKPWLALAVLVVPHSGEVFFNPTNMQWVAALGLVLTAVKLDPESRANWRADLAWIVAGGLTGPFSLFVAPLFLLRAVRRRTRASWIMLAVVVAVAAVQAWFVAHAPKDTEFVGPFGGVRALAPRCRFA